MTDALIKPFEQAAEAAHRAEGAYAKEFERELAQRRRAREFAYRRLGLIRELMTAARAETCEISVAAQCDCLRNELGWHDVSGAKDKVIAEFAKLATVIHANLAVGSGESIAEAFTAFEAWYENETGTPFLALLDHDLPEMPVVDF